MLRAALPPDAANDDTEESVTVAEAARRLGCDTSTVRELLRLKQLSGHRVGKHAIGDDGRRNAPRAVRVHAESIRRYISRNSLGAPASEPAARSRRISISPGAAEARRRLRELGVL